MACFFFLRILSALNNRGVSFAGNIPFISAPADYYAVTLGMNWKPAKRMKINWKPAQKVNIGSSIRYDRADGIEMPSGHSMAGRISFCSPWTPPSRSSLQPSQPTDSGMEILSKGFVHLKLKHSSCTLDFLLPFINALLLTLNFPDHRSRFSYSPLDTSGMLAVVEAWFSLSLPAIWRCIAAACRFFLIDFSYLRINAWAWD